MRGYSGEWLPHPGLRRKYSPTDSLPPLPLGDPEQSRQLENKQLHVWSAALTLHLHPHPSSAQPAVSHAGLGPGSQAMFPGPGHGGGDKGKRSHRMGMESRKQGVGVGFREVVRGGRGQDLPPPPKILSFGQR